MPLTRLDGAPAHEMHGFTFRPLATPASGSAELAVWVVDAPAGAASPVHSMSREEVFVVQSGQVEAEVDGERHGLSAGDALCVPAGRPLRLSNPYAAAARLVACTSAGMEATVEGRTMSPPWAR